jgi:hypothetical protein
MQVDHQFSHTWIRRNSQPGDAFPAFFRALAADMKRRASISMAWVKLAPESAQAQATLSLPATIFSLQQHEHPRATR